MQLLMAGNAIKPYEGKKTATVIEDFLKALEHYQSLVPEMTDKDKIDNFASILDKGRGEMVGGV